jgi:hypothetical protein
MIHAYRTFIRLLVIHPMRAENFGKSSLYGLCEPIILRMIHPITTNGTRNPYADWYFKVIMLTYRNWGY